MLRRRVKKMEVAGKKRKVNGKRVDALRQREKEEREWQVDSEVSDIRDG